MTETLIPMDSTPTGMRLTEWVATEEGFFADEGLEVRVDWDVLTRQQTAYGAVEDKDYDDIAQLRLGRFLARSELTTACAWGTICMAGAGMGRVRADAHGVSPSGVYVRPDSAIRTPADLADVPIAVGLRAGSHFSLLATLEPHVPLERIKPVNHGGFGARLKVLADGVVEAASLLPPQNYMAEQLGMRCVLAGEFWTGWWVNDGADEDKVERYLRAIERAERALDDDLQRYLPLWRYSNPAEFADQPWNYAAFGRGERFMREPISNAAFDRLLDDARRWGLDNHMVERGYDAIMAVPA